MASSLPTQSVVVESTTSPLNLSEDSDEEGPSGKPRFCLVCGHLSHGYHFGILACRACAAFFRRTVVEKKTYRCRQSGECKIRKEMRNMCRSCRYDLCIQLGMNRDDVQMYRDPIGKRNAKKNNATAVSSSSSAPTEQKRKRVVAAAAPAIPTTGCVTARAAFARVASSSSVPTSSLLGTVPTTNTASPPNADLASSVSELRRIGGIGISSATGAMQPTPPALSSSAFFPDGSGTVPTTTTTTAAPAAPTLPAGLLHFALSPSVRPSSTLQQQSLTTTAGPSVDTPAAAIALLPCALPSPSESPSVLQRLVDGYRNFQSSQKSLYTVMYPDNIFAGETYRLIKHSEYVKMERGCISLMFSMLTDCFHPFDSLDQPTKLSALRAFANRFTHLDQCYRTVALFPADDDPRFVLHYGQYVNLEKLDHFFGEIEHPEDTIRACSKTLQRARTIAVKMRDMGVRDVEIAAVAAIILWNELSYMRVDGTHRVRSAIFAELHNNMILTYGIANTGIRLGSLMDLIHDMDLVEKEISESVIISKFFNQNFADVWEDA
ncbi:hypothetical protein niasHS_005351 [Heterodera schachtii]|uniref:Nuclear receptor n=2 Tax=Heterodera TaxID=34509 RepID=A0ABD2J993_HETSC